MRASKDDHLKALKLGSFRLIEAAGDGEAAAITRVQAAALSKYKAGHQTEHFVPVDVLLDLELFVGYPIVTEVLARLHGKRLVADERMATESDAEALRDQLDAIEDDTARLRLTLREALRDGRVDHGERTDIRRKLDALRVTLDELEGLL